MCFKTFSCHQENVIFFPKSAVRFMCLKPHVLFLSNRPFLQSQLIKGKQVASSNPFFEFSPAFFCFWSRNFCEFCQLVFWKDRKVTKKATKNQKKKDEKTFFAKYHCCTCENRTKHVYKKTKTMKRRTKLSSFGFPKKKRLKKSKENLLFRNWKNTVKKNIKTKTLTSDYS